MSDSFSGELWRGVAGVYDAILVHPFLTGLTDGSLPHDAFRRSTWCKTRSTCTVTLKLWRPWPAGRPRPRKPRCSRHPGGWRPPPHARPAPPLPAHPAPRYAKKALAAQPQAAQMPRAVGVVVGGGRHRLTSGPHRLAGTVQLPGTPGQHSPRPGEVAGVAGSVGVVLLAANVRWLSGSGTAVCGTRRPG